MVEARLYRELALDARRLVARSGRSFAAVLSLLHWSAAGAAATAVAGLLYIVAPEIKALIPEPGTAVAAAPPSLPVDRASSEPTAPSLVVSVDGGNLRSRPSSTAPIVARLERGTPVIAREQRGDWAKVASTDGRSEGWIHRSLLDEPPPPTN